MRWPEGFAGGTRITGLAQLHDLAATVLAAAGCATDELDDLMPDARSLLPLAQGREARVHDHAICCYRNSGITTDRAYWDPPIHATMIRDERYKLNVWHDPDGTRGEPQGELYDMQRDPNELQNLWSDPGHEAVRLGLMGRMMDWLAVRERAHGSRGGESQSD